MTLSTEFYELSKDKQEEEATKIANDYYKRADEWRRIAVKARIGTLKKPKQKINETLSS
jgi:hypothetical protein